MPRFPWSSAHPLAGFLRVLQYLNNYEIEKAVCSTACRGAVLLGHETLTILAMGATVKSPGRCQHSGLVAEDREGELITLTIAPKNVSLWL
jgi:hypothetical protein